ncbi:MAG: transaldolase family protein [bacterium]|nr:transaldolase family protein [bacterium]
MTKFLLDSGDPNEYREISKIAKDSGSEIWGATTNPSLIAKKLAGQKITPEKAYKLQKEIVMEIIEIVPGAVSAEVYADTNTTAEEMTEQGIEITKWHPRVVVKIPTTLEGFKARTALRKEKVITNNTLVFSQEQIFAICLHEKICRKSFGLIDPPAGGWPPFISPFVGRLDDIGQNGMDLVKNGIRIKKLITDKNLAWMLEASVRKQRHIKEGIDVETELITAPAVSYREWFEKQEIKEEAKNELKPIDFWQPPQELIGIDTTDKFMSAIVSGKLNINHDLTDKGIARFVEDWKAILV